MEGQKGQLRGQLMFLYVVAQEEGSMQPGVGNSGESWSKAILVQDGVVGQFLGDPLTIDT